MSKSHLLVINTHNRLIDFSRLMTHVKSFDYILGKVLDHQVNNIHKRYINLREHVPNQISKYTPDNYYMSLTDTNLLEQKPYQLHFAYKNISE